MFRVGALFNGFDDRLDCLCQEKDGPDQEKAEFDFDAIPTPH